MSLMQYVVGGTPESQREFLNTFSADTTGSGFKNDKRKGGAPPVANQFALGYTYLDVLDADHEGVFFLSKVDHSFELQY